MYPHLFILPLFKRYLHYIINQVQNFGHQQKKPSMYHTRKTLSLPSLFDIEIRHFYPSVETVSFKFFKIS